MKRNYNQSKNYYQQKTNNAPSFWNLRYGNCGFSPEEIAHLKKRYQEEQDEMEVNRLLQIRMKAEEKFKECSFNSNEKLEILESELKKVKRSIKSLEEENEELKEENINLRSKLKKQKSQKKKSIIEASSSDEEQEKEEEKSALQETLEKEIDGTITLEKIKKLTIARLKEITEEFDLKYSNKNQAASLIFSSL